MNMQTTRHAPGEARQIEAHEIVRELPDPEMPWVTLGDLGIVRSVRVGEGGSVHVELTPTYLGCPAIEAMRADVRAALDGAGYRVEAVELRLDPPWTPASITAQGRRKLAEAGIAPPAHIADPEAAPSGAAAGHTATTTTPLSLGVRCPNCGSIETALLSRFGASPCQELRRCSACAEPFPAVRS